MLFNLPRTLGTTADGEPILANVGRFGPYIKYGAKYVSMKEDDPYTVTLERALELIRLKQEADANRLIVDFTDDGHPGAERPLRPVHHRWQEERQGAQGPRAQIADARGMPQAARGSAGSRQPLRPRQARRRAQGGRDSRRQRSRTAGAATAPRRAAKRAARVQPAARPATAHPAAARPATAGRGPHDRRPRARQPRGPAPCRPEPGLLHRRPRTRTRF